MPTQLDAADVVVLYALRDELAVKGPVLVELLPQVTPADLQVWEGQAVLGLVRERLLVAGLLEHVAPAVRGQMASIVQEYVRISDLYVRETHDVIAGLRADGIFSLVLKDPRGFARPDLRPSYDLDLLVPAGSLADCSHSLRRQGFTRRPGQQQEQLLGREASWTRTVSGLSVAIDLHWHILDAYRPRRSNIDLRRLFDEATTVRTEERDLPVLSLEHHLMAVCLHACEHELRFPSRLVTWLDISETVRTHGATIDWDRFVNLCREFGALNEAYVGLRVARTLLRADIPETVTTALRQRFQTLGVEQSCFGYWNYSVKFLDDVDRHAHPGHSGLPVAERALRDAKEVWRRCEEMGSALARAGADVLSFGEPAEMFIPESKLCAVGDVELLVQGLPSADVFSVLRECGVDTSSNATLGGPAGEDLPPNGNGTDVARLRVDAPEEPVSGQQAEHTLPWLLRSLLLRAPGRPDYRVRVYIVDDGPAAAKFLLSRLASNDAVELRALVALADLWKDSSDVERRRIAAVAVQPRDKVLLELAADTGSRAGTRIPTWSFLRGLDNRSRNVEALTKALVSPPTIRVVRHLEGRGARRLGVILCELARRPAGSLRDVVHVVKECCAPVGQRVPPRIYLSPTGASLTSLRQ